MHESAPNSPLDAPLIDRLLQPTFDRLYARAGVPVTLVAAEAWLALIACSVGEGTLHLIGDRPAARRCCSTRLSSQRSSSSPFVLRARHRAWCAAPFSHAGQLPRAYLSFAPVRCILLLLIGCLSIPRDVAQLLAGDNPLEPVMGIAVDATILIALYADACRAPPPSALHRTERRLSAVPANA